jgi:SAM-dependent methyltransferase
MTTPKLINDRSARAYLDFVADARGTLMNAQWGAMTGLGHQLIAAYEQRTEASADSVAAVRAALLDTPEMSAFFRVKRSLQEACWQRIIDACAPLQDELLATLAATEQQGPGSVQLNPHYTYPEYAQVDIHIQPGGYTQHPLAGLIYDLGTQVFFGGGNVDALHAATAERTLAPLDEKVTRVVDIGCSVGQMSCALKHRFPDAEVWGTDISGPMVQYAHWRAVQHNCDVHFAQMPAEQLDFPDGHADLIVAHILFHELPVPVIKATVKEAFRVLRPGGAFVIWDFPTATADNPGFGNFMGIMDAADNGEPYAIGFVRCNVEDLMLDAGFNLRSNDPGKIQQQGRIGDKPG